MPASRSASIITLLALCPFSIGLVHLARVRHSTPLRRPPARRSGSPPRSPSEAAWRQAFRCWFGARETAAQELESLEEWDPKVTVDFRHEDWLRRREARLRRLMAGDPRGDLRRAHSAATRAARLARTPHETFEAALLLSRIDCDLGRHQAQLDQARLLMRLAPHRAESLEVMQRAAGHNGLKPLVEQASMALAALEEARKER